MPSPPVRRSRWILALVVLAGCRHGETDVSNGPAARLDAASPISRTGPVATALTSPLVVRVIDASGKYVVGATVTFAVTQGNGSVSPRVTTSDNRGSAETIWTFGTVAGLNEVTAAVAGVATPIKFTGAGTPGAAAMVIVSPKLARIVNGTDTVRISATSRDAYGNTADPSPTYTVRDPTLVSVTTSGLVRALRRGGSTYVVAVSGGRSDSALVTVLALGESICTGVSSPLRLGVGQVVTDLTGDVCVRAATTTEEYALVGYFNSAVPSATTQIETRTFGITTVSSSAAIASLLPSSSTSQVLVRDESFEQALRRREAFDLAAAASAARTWFNSRRATRVSGASFAVAAAPVPAVGDLIPLNVNAIDNCTRPDLRTGRVVAVTNKAIVVADTANPANGFSDAEYRSFAVTFDTLIDPVNSAAFGTPADFDENGGRSILFFTRAVNAMTPRGSGSVVLGLFNGRDILPKATCTSGNFAKMFYLLVPDSAGTVSDARSKGIVTTVTNGTIAHEYQHLINATRRMYVNNAANTTEEYWLNEGLSHVAEELNYFASARLQPRMNLDAAALAPSIANGTFQTYMANNFSRYRRYLQSTESQSPMGSDPFDDDLPTRGAGWAFLRYAADHQPGSNGDGTFWFKLVNGTNTGVANLAAALGTSPTPMLRDFSIAVYLDDTNSGIDSRFQQTSWNLRSALPAGGFTFALFTRTLNDGTSFPVTLAGGGTVYERFAVQAGQDALLAITSLGQQLLPAIQLSLVRVR